MKLARIFIIALLKVPTNLAGLNDLVGLLPSDDETHGRASIHLDDALKCLRMRSVQERSRWTTPSIKMDNPSSRSFSASASAERSLSSKDLS